MRMPCLVLGLTAASLLGSQDKDAAWKEYASKEGRFVVLMPGVPVEQKENVKTPSGPIDLTMAVVERKKEETAYLVIFSEFPEAVLKKGTADQRLDYARNRAAASTKGKLTSEIKIRLGDYPGRELHLEVEGKGMVRLRMYAVKDRLYQLLVAGPKERALGKEADRFLTSFQLKP